MFCILEAISCCNMSPTHIQLRKINNKLSDYISNEGKDIKRKAETAAKERMIVSLHCEAGWRRWLNSWSLSLVLLQLLLSLDPKILHVCLSYPRHSVSESGLAPLAVWFKLLFQLWQRWLLFYFKNYLIPSVLNDGFYETTERHLLGGGSHMEKECWVEMIRFISASLLFIVAYKKLNKSKVPTHKTHHPGADTLLLAAY